MLKNLDPLLGPELLHVLASMGHGDDLAVVDANFPADAVARETASGILVRLDGIDLPATVRAIVSVYPLDPFVDDPVRRMEVVGDPSDVPAVQRECLEEIRAAESPKIDLVGIERFAFYDAARQAYAVVATGERRPYGDLLLRKGVVFG